MRAPLITFSVDPELCVQCYSCRKECPFDLIVEDKEKLPLLRKAAMKKCIHCGHCMAVCPTAALDISISPLAESQAVQPKELPAGDRVAKLLASRRSIRSYKQKVVDHELLAQLLTCSSYAPSAHNGQPVHWLMVEDPRQTRRLASLVVDWFVELKLFPGLVRAWQDGHDKVLRDAPHLAIAHANPEASEHPVEDCTLATAYLELAAHSYGLGACWAGFLMQGAHQYGPLTEALALPEGHRVYSALMLGYPKFRYQRLPKRPALPVQWR